MNDIIISKMTRDDLQGVYEVENQSFPIPWPISSFEEELNNLLATYLVAKKKDKIVAYIGMWFVMDECHIMNVAVLPECRRQGIATSLIHEMFSLCKEHETHYVMLEVRKENLSAQSLYKKFGFTEEVVRKAYYKNPDGTREDAIVMSLELTNT